MTTNTTNTITSSPLFSQIKEQLHEDWSRLYTGDKSKTKEILNDTPSNSLVKLYSQIPSEQVEDWFECIEEEIDKICEYTNTHM